MTHDHFVHIGVISAGEIKKRTIDIASGRLKPKPTDPKVWITSPKFVAELLSGANVELLKTIRKRQPASVSQLAEMTGRSQGNLSRTLKSMSQYGLVDMVRESNHVRPVSTVSHLQLDIALI
jgi:predicted transcriptional regulator